MNSVDFKKICTISNKNHLRNRLKRLKVAPTNHPIITGLLKIKKKPKKILEIGCSTGFILERLRLISKKSSCYGLDTSELAIREGKKIFPKLKLFHGEFLTNKINKKKFDLIIFGFFLFMLPSSQVLSLFLKAHESLGANGYIIIYDFKPNKKFTKKNYKHSKFIKVYKWDFKKVFLSTPTYKMVYNKTKFKNKEFKDTELSVIKKIIV